MNNITVYGVPLSPFVRKVRLALALKGIEHNINPVIPFGDGQPEEFKKHSPLGKIPLLSVNGEEFIPDSSVICGWLDRVSTDKLIVPADPSAAARALWFEEYADSHMASIIGGHLFAEVVLARAFFGREPNQDEIELAKTKEIPEIFDYIEGELSGDYLVADEITLADLAVGSVFVNMMHAGHQCDGAKWPKTAAYIERLHGSEMFASLIAQEKQFLAG